MSEGLLEENLPQRTPNDDPQLSQESEFPPKITEALNLLPEEHRETFRAALREEIQIVHETVQETVMERFSGPLPPPHILKEFNDVIPGCAEAILQMTVDQGEHRRKLETFVVENQNRQSGRGQILGFVLALFVMLVCGFLIYTGHEVSGAVLGIGDLTALVSVFVLGRRDQKKDLKDKEDD